MVGYEFRKVIDDAGAYCNGDHIQFLEIILKLFDVLPLCEQFRVVEYEWGFGFHTGIPEIAVHCLSGHFESVVICHDYGFLSGKEFLNMSGTLAIQPTPNSIAFVSLAFRALLQW